MKNKLFYLLVLLSLVLVAGVACTPGQPGAADAPGGEDGQPQRVVYLINGALGDNAFYDSGQAGIDAIAAEYGVETRTIETNFDAGQYEPALRAAVDY
ncbi:MAG TPA: hypothetical protein PK801_16415, partial [Aggregatilineales bacterium]|nr:hypothetical protein [Aggregatilineales bacterium]